MSLDVYFYTRVKKNSCSEDERVFQLSIKLSWKEFYSVDHEHSLVGIRNLGLIKSSPYRLDFTAEALRYSLLT